MYGSKDSNILKRRGGGSWWGEVEIFQMTEKGHCSWSCQSHLKPNHNFNLNISCCARLIYSISAAWIELRGGAWYIQSVYSFVLCCPFSICFHRTHKHNTHPLFNAWPHPLKTSVHVCLWILQSIKKKIHYITKCDCLQKIMIGSELKGSSRFKTTEDKGTHKAHRVSVLLCSQEIYIPLCHFIKFIMNVNY